MMRRPLLIAGVTALVLNVLFTFIGRGSFIHLVMVLGLVLWIASPVLLLAAVTMVVATRMEKRLYAKAAYVVLLASLVMWSLSISILTGDVVRERDIARAKAYCESLIPALERHRGQRGSYPQTLEGISLAKEHPRLLIGSAFYRSDGEAYCFDFGDPGRLMGYVAYDSTRREWHEWD